MDIQQYDRIFNYLQTQKLLNDLNTKQLEKSFKNFSKPFIIHNNLLYRKDKNKNGSLLKVIRKFEVEPILYISDVHLEDWKHLWKHHWKVWKHNLLIKSFGLEASNQVLYYWKHKMHNTAIYGMQLLQKEERCLLKQIKFFF